MNKKILSLMIFLTIFLIGCTSNKKNELSASLSDNNQSQINDSNENAEINKEEITNFSALNKEYSVNKDISTLSNGTVIYDPSNNPYKEGEYVEIDFAKDIITAYLNENPNIYNYLVSYNSSNDGIVAITEEDKNKLEKNLSTIKNEMSFGQNDKVIVLMSRVTFQGSDRIINKGTSLNVRVGIAHAGDTTAPWVVYNVTVFKDNSKLFAHIM